MGEDIVIYCRTCLEKRSKMFFKNRMFFQYLSLGRGFFSPEGYCIQNSSEKNPVIYTPPIKDKMIQNEIKYMLKNGAKILNEYFSIYYCENCLKIFNNCHIEIDNNGIIYEPKYICNKCKNSLIEVEYKEIYNNIIFKNTKGEIVKVKCRKCNSDNFSIDIVGLWD
jgi:hypothetical protein